MSRSKLMIAMAVLAARQSPFCGSVGAAFQTPERRSDRQAWALAQ